MTKSQLIDRISEKLPTANRREVELIVNTVFDSMVEALRTEERIEIRGFGSFGVKMRDARDGRNPKTGERVSVPERRIPYFTVGKELRERLNGGPLQQPEEHEPISYTSRISSSSDSSSQAIPMVAAPPK